MFRKLFIGTAIAGVLAFGIPTGTFAQESAGQHMKKAGRKMKKAGKATAEAAKETGRATKEAAKETGEGTKKVAKKIKRKVTPDTTSVRCNDGTVQAGKTKTTACANHGGVKG
jgi:hypothetical protein